MNGLLWSYKVTVGHMGDVRETKVSFRASEWHPNEILKISNKAQQDALTPTQGSTRHSVE